MLTLFVTILWKFGLRLLVEILIAACKFMSVTEDLFLTLVDFHVRKTLLTNICGSKTFWSSGALQWLSWCKIQRKDKKSLSGCSAFNLFYKILILRTFFWPHLLKCLPFYFMTMPFSPHTIFNTLKQSLTSVCIVHRFQTKYFRCDDEIFISSQ